MPFMPGDSGRELAKAVPTGDRLDPGWSGRSERYVGGVACTVTLTVTPTAFGSSVMLNWSGPT